MSTNIALKRKLSDMVSQYDAKKKEIKKYTGNDLITAVTIDGMYGQENIDTGRSIHESSMRKNLLRSAWLNIHKELKLDILMSAKS